jgi:glucose-1-phosphate thymidylyltransferase
LNRKKLKLELLGRGYAWLDTGTHESLMNASNYVEIIEKRQGLKIACLEEIAIMQKYITYQDIENSLTSYGKSTYADYLKKLKKYDK